MDTAHFDLVIAANRLPVDKVTAPDGTTSWARSPGGLVTAMDAVMRDRPGAWVGWAGDAGPAPEPFADGGLAIIPVPLSQDEIAAFYEGFSNDTLWPIYHDVIVPATFHRTWWSTYAEVNRRFADRVCDVAADGATVWIHDYQLQLVPALVRERRPDVRIGWFNHIPFPPVELFAQLPWREQILHGLLGADFLGFQRAPDAENFVRAAAVPISIDTAGLDALARTPSVRQRAREIRASLGNPRKVLLGVDRLDYTKGIRHRLKAYEELLRDDIIRPPDVVLVQVATPSRERVAAYRDLRTEVERTVGRINGEFAAIGSSAVEYLHHSYDREEMAALYLAADVMLVTPLRDGMNLVAKEYVACRYDEDGALVLSEFTGAYQEFRALGGRRNTAFFCNPHDIEGLKRRMAEAIRAPRRARRARMQALRAIVHEHDVEVWAQTFLASLAFAPAAPPKEPAS